MEKTVRYLTREKKKRKEEEDLVRKVEKTLSAEKGDRPGQSLPNQKSRAVREMRAPGGATARDIPSNGQMGLPGDLFKNGGRQRKRRRGNESQNLGRNSH